MTAIVQAWVPVCDGCGHQRWERKATREEAEAAAGLCDCTAYTCPDCAMADARRARADVPEEEAS